MLQSVWDIVQSHPVGVRSLQLGIEKQYEQFCANSLIVGQIQHPPALLSQALLKSAFAGDMKCVRMLVEQYLVHPNALDKVFFLK